MHASAMVDLPDPPRPARGGFGYSGRGWAVVPLMLAVVVAACGRGTTVPSPSVAPSPQASPTLELRVIPTRPPLSYPPLTDSGSRATVIVYRLQVLDRLALVEFPNGAAPRIALGEGTEILLTDGPLPNAHLDWYLAYFSWLPSDQPYFQDVTFGWVAAGPTGQPPTSIHIEAPRCPASVDAKVIGGMSILARVQCLGTGPHEVSGVIHGCTDHSVDGAPAWLFTKCLSLVDADGTPTGLFLFFPPQLDSAGLVDGDVIHAVGHIDDPIASECRLPNPYPGISPFEHASLVTQCRSAFVVSEIEVTDHVQLPQ